MVKGRRKIVIPGARIRELLESGLERELPSSLVAEFDLSRDLSDYSFLVARLDYEVGVGAKGYIYVNPEGEKDAIVIFRGDNHLSEKEEYAIRATTGRALHLEGELGDLIHYFITGKDFPETVREEQPLLATSRMPSVVQPLLLFSMLSKAWHFAGEEGVVESREEAKAFVELLSVIGYDAEGIQTLYHSSLPRFKNDSEPMTLSLSGGWRWDYNRLEHRLPLLPAVFAAKSDLTFDALEKGLFTGVLERYANVPDKNITGILHELNHFRNEYRKYVKTIMGSPDYERFLMDPANLGLAVYGRHHVFLQDPIAMLAVQKVTEAIQFAHEYARVYCRASRSEIEQEALPLFAASMRLWNGLFGSPIIEHRRDEMVPYIIDKLKESTQ